MSERLTTLDQDSPLEGSEATKAIRVAAWEKVATTTEAADLAYSKYEAADDAVGAAAEFNIKAAEAARAEARGNYEAAQAASVTAWEEWEALLPGNGMPRSASKLSRLGRRLREFTNIG